MKRVLVVHPSFHVVGGGEMVALHLLRWLTQRKRVEVTLLRLCPSFILRYLSTEDLLENFERLVRDSGARAEGVGGLVRALDRFRVPAFEAVLERLPGTFLSVPTVHGTP